VTVLLYQNRKADTMLIDVSTKEKYRAGFYRLFKHLDTEWGVYSDPKDGENTGGYLRKVERRYYEKAAAGDVEAAYDLLKQRNGNEYEMWQIVEVTDPLASTNNPPLDASD